MVDKVVIGMKKFVPFNKRSKKEQRESNNAKREVWENVKPITKVKESKKRYNRNAFKSGR
jgi:hypothetical protein